MTDRTLSMICALYRKVVTSKTSFSLPSGAAAVGASRLAMGSIMVADAGSDADHTIRSGAAIVVDDDYTVVAKG